MTDLTPVDRAATDVLDEAGPWLAQCGFCDAGLPMSCSHPQGDYRLVMARLVAEVERLRAEPGGQLVRCGATNDALGLTCNREPHPAGTAHYQDDGDAVRAWYDPEIGDAA